MNSTALIEPVPIARPNQACPGVGLRWGVCQTCRRQLQQEFSLSVVARIQERARIARELHDTLLQSFQGLLLRFQAVANLLPTRPQDAKHKLENAIDLTAQAITEGRDAVQGLRRTTLTNDLAMALHGLGREFVANWANCDHIHFLIDVWGEPRNLHPVLREEVYCIAAEALRNAFQHAQAHNIEVEIRYDNRLLRLRVRDDGKGLDGKTLAEGGRDGHFGLHGMRERAQTIGGKLDVWSGPASGTEVELSIPASRAYVAPSQAGSFWPPEKASRKGSAIGL